MSQNYDCKKQPSVHENDNNILMKFRRKLILGKYWKTHSEMYSVKCCKNNFLFYKIHCKSVTMVTTPTYFLPSTLKKELKGLQLYMFLIHCALWLRAFVGN